MNTRQKKINLAISQAKKRDGACLVCGRSSEDTVLHGAHILPRNSPFPRYSAYNPDHILTLCYKHHIEYDQYHSPYDKLDWLREKGLKEAAAELEWILRGKAA